jgi:hypothetical protein
MIFITYNKAIKADDYNDMFDWLRQNRGVYRFGNVGFFFEHDEDAVIFKIMFGDRLKL